MRPVKGENKGHWLKEGKGKIRPGSAGGGAREITPNMQTRSWRVTLVVIITVHSEETTQLVDFFSFFVPAIFFFLPLLLSLYLFKSGWWF